MIKKMIEIQHGNVYEYIKLFIVFVFILIIAYGITSYTYTEIEWIDFMRNIMGVFFIIFAIFQFIGYKSFVSMFIEYDPIAKYINNYSYAYPFIGILLGSFYLLDLFSPWRDVFTVIILFVGAYGIWKILKQKKSQVHCACLGDVIKLPVSTITLVEDLTMGTMAFIMILSQFFL